jgi:hypothetical protein
VLPLAGRIISSEEALGPATAMETTGGFDPYRAASTVRKVRQALYKMGSTASGSPLCRPLARNPQMSPFRTCSKESRRVTETARSQLGILANTHSGELKPGDTTS